MDIMVYAVGDYDGYEVVRRTVDTNPEWVYFIVQTRWGGHKKLVAWAVDTTSRRGVSLLLYRLLIALPFIRVTVEGPYGLESCLARVELTLDEAFSKACRYAESLAGVSAETSRIIDEHSVDIRARLLAQQEVEMIAPTAETG